MFQPHAPKKPAEERLKRNRPHIRWLLTHRDSPGLPDEGTIPWTTYGLYVNAGYGQRPGQGLTNERQIEFWSVVRRGWPQLHTWLLSDQAFRPPDSWPKAVQVELELAGVGHLEPRHLAAAFDGGVPCKWQSDLSTNVGSLLMYARGWPLRYRWLTQHPEDELVLGAQELCQHLQFIVWACAPLLHTVPLTGARGIRKCIKARSQLATDPLSTSDGQLVDALPTMYLDATAPCILSELPRSDARPMPCKGHFVADENTHREPFHA